MSAIDGPKTIWVESIVIYLDLQVRNLVVSQPIYCHFFVNKNLIVRAVESTPGNLHLVIYADAQIMLNVICNLYCVGGLLLGIDSSG